MTREELDAELRRMLMPEMVREVDTLWKELHLMQLGTRQLERDLAAARATCEAQAKRLGELEGEARKFVHEVKTWTTSDTTFAQLRQIGDSILAKLRPASEHRCPSCSHDLFTATIAASKPIIFQCNKCKYEWESQAKPAKVQPENPKPKETVRKRYVYEEWEDDVDPALPTKDGPKYLRLVPLEGSK